MAGLSLTAWVVAVALGVLPTAAQEVGAIRGRVVDARTGAGLGKVLVLVEDVGPSALTDDSGAFQLAPVKPGARRLYVSVVGYILVRRDVQVVAGGASDLTIPLSEGTGTYTETVTVAADRFRPAETAVASQQVLGSADIQNLRGVLADDPLRAVQVLPGVATGDDLRSEFSVRGSDFTHMNLTVEGFSTPFLLHTVRAVEDRSASGSVAMINSDYTDRQAHETYWSDLDQRHTLNLYLFYRLSDRMSVSAKLRAGSNVPAPGYYLERNGEYFVSSTRNEVRLPTYARVDLRANRTFNWSRKRLTLFAEVMNVLNRDNVRYNPPGVNTTTGRVSSMFESMIPIVPSAGMLIEF